LNLIHIAQLKIATFASYERSPYFLRRLPYFHTGFLWYTIFMNLSREFEGHESSKSLKVW